MSDLVISQTPYRISLGGGGTDLPFYANEKGGRSCCCNSGTLGISKDPTKDDTPILQYNVDRYCNR